MKITAISLSAMFVVGLVAFGLKQVYSAGHQAARTETLEKAVDLVQERDKLNVTVRNATAADICRRLGGRMLEDGECG